jgi:hypothetical protein
MTTIVDHITPPALPTAPEDYEHLDSEQFRNILRLFFNRLSDNLNVLALSLRPLVITDTTTARTLVPDDERAIILFTSGSAITVTIPTDLGPTDPSVDGAYITHVYQRGAGQVTVVGDVGVTTNDAASSKTRAQYSSLTIVQTGNNDYNIIGDME